MTTTATPTPPKPAPSPPIDVGSIPAELRDVAHWIVWRWTDRGGKWTKPPYDPIGRHPTDATDRAAWMTLDRALELARDYDGIGFAVSDTPFTGVDLDKCLDESGAIEPWAKDIVEHLNSYTEVTPSGRGLRVWVEGKLPPGRRRTGNLEMYDGGRFFTVTGHRWGNTPAGIGARQSELSALHSEVFPAKPDKERPQRTPIAIPLDDKGILDRMFRARNGREVEALFRGEPGRHHSGSEADLALCAHLAFWTGGDILAIDRLFRLSALCDDKWTERADYRERTIAKALEGANWYDPNFGRAVLNGHAKTALGGNGGDDPPEGEGDGEGGPARPGEAEDDPHRLARLFLTTRYGHPEGPTLRYWNEEWHQWDGLAWRPRLEREVNALMTREIKAEFDRIAVGASAIARQVSTKLVGNVSQSLRDVALLQMEICPRQPSWLGPFQVDEDLPDPREILPARNALIHLPSFIEGEPYLLRPTPRFFSPNMLDYDFDPDAPDPAEWLAFLDGLWPDDPESVDALQEWFGYLLTPDTSQQKMLVLIGPKRSGKGTIGRILRAIVGPDNVTAPTLSGLATNFGLAPLIGKTLALVADARLSGRADSQIIVERLLSISGEDAQTIDRKHLSQWTGNLPTRFVVVSNELPRLGDSSGAMPSRMILLRLTKSFYGVEDPSLTSRLLAERTAILRWAIRGWARLHARGRFLQPESGAELIDDMDELSSPVGTFVAERCDSGPDESVEIKEIFEAWKVWCKEKGKDHPGDEQGFGRNIRAVLPGLKTKRPDRGGVRVRRYHGVDLKPEFRMSAMSATNSTY